MHNKVGYVNLHTHSHYSLLDGLSKIPDLVDTAVELGHCAVSVTDHGNIMCWPELVKFAGEKNIKPILGVEAYMAPWGTSASVKKKVKYDEEKSGLSFDAYSHLTLLSKNSEGAKSLIRLVSRSESEGTYYKPRLDLEMIRQENPGQNLICLTGCPSSEISTRIRLEQYDMAEKVLESYIDVFGKDNVYVEIMAHGFEDGDTTETCLIKPLLSLSKKYGLPLVATSDSHYTKETDHDLHEAVLALQTRAKLKDEKRFRFNGTGYHFRTADENLTALIKDGYPEKEAKQAIENTGKIADKIEIYDLPHGKGFELWPKHGVDGDLYEIAEKRLTEKLGRKLGEEEQSRLSYEIHDVIEPKGFEGYFFLTMDITDYCRENNILLGAGRGSATGCLTAYALGITRINPLKYGLSFERFLNPQRKSPPDIDIDVQFDKLGELISYIEGKYGKESVAHIGTVSKMGGKLAIRDMARVHSVPPYQADALCDVLPAAPAKPEIKDYMQQLGVVADKYSISPDVLDMAQRAEGTVRSKGMHPCGVIVSGKKIIDYIPTVRGENGETVTMWEYPVLEEQGFIKEDLLGLRTLALISEVIEKTDAPSFTEFCEGNLDDPKAYQLLRSRNMLGIFQSEGGIGPIYEEMGVNNIKEISIALALFRPGPIGMGAHQAYIRRKKGLENPDTVENTWRKWRSKHPGDIANYLDDPNPPPYRHYYVHPEIAETVKKVCADSLGLIVYQEQIMKLAVELAGYTAGEADSFRKAIGKKKKEVLEEQYEPFRKGMEKNGYSLDAIEALWQVIVPFAQYSFNYSHTVGYGYITYITAYLKAHYGAEFYAAYMNAYIDKTDKIKSALAESIKLGYKIEPPQLGQKNTTATGKNKTIYLPFTALKGVGEKQAELLTELPKKATIKQIAETGANKTVISALCKAGTLTHLGENRQEILEWIQEEYSKYAANIKEEKPVIEPQFGKPKDQIITIAKLEEEVFGFYATCHPLQKLEPLEKLLSPKPLKNLTKGIKSGAIGIIKNKPAIRKAKSGRNWCKIFLTTPTGETPILIFDKQLLEKITKMSQNTLIQVTGTASGDGSLIAKTIKKLELNNQGLIQFNFIGVDKKEARAAWWAKGENKIEQIVCHLEFSDGTTWEGEYYPIMAGMLQKYYRACV